MSAPEFEVERLAFRPESIVVSTGGEPAVKAVITDRRQVPVEWSIMGCRVDRSSDVPVFSPFPMVKTVADRDRVEYAAKVIAAGLDALGDLPGTKTHRVHIVLEAVMCDVCDTYFGVPKSFDGKPFHCPNGHPNEGREFDKEN